MSNFRPQDQRPPPIDLDSLNDHGLEGHVVEYQWSIRDAGEVIFTASTDEADEMPETIRERVMGLGLMPGVELECSALIKYAGISAEWYTLARFDLGVFELESDG